MGGYLTDTHPQLDILRRKWPFLGEDLNIVDQNNKIDKAKTQLVLMENDKICHLKNFHSKAGFPDNFIFHNKMAFKKFVKACDFEIRPNSAGIGRNDSRLVLEHNLETFDTFSLKSYDPNMIFEKNIWGSQWGGYFETARYPYKS